MIEQTCLVTNINTGIEVEADILEYKRKKQLSCSVMKSIKLVMKWDNVHKEYQGKYGNMEFVSDGPKDVKV